MAVAVRLCYWLMPFVRLDMLSIWVHPAATTELFCNATTTLYIALFNMVVASYLGRKIR
jgi:hypothetical protein